jgi:hypothetical protein
MPPQHRADTRQQLPKAERLGDVVVGAEFEADHPIDLVVAMAGGDDYRDVGSRPDLAQQVETVLRAEPQIQDDQAGNAFGDLTSHFLRL